MSLWRPARRVRHLKRYREIVSILAHHGYWALIEQLGLLSLVTWPARLRRQEPPTPQSLATHVRAALIELGPTFIKLGQVLSTRPDLIPPEFLAELNKLQDDVPPLPWEVMRPVLEASLQRPMSDVFAEFDTTPLGSASLAQVYAAVLKDGQEVVVKIQRPGIRHTIEIDLEILRDIAQLAQERTSLGKIYDLVDIAEDFAFTLKRELNYIQEGRNADRLRQNMASIKGVYVPRVFWDYTTEHVIVLERLRGIKIDDIEALRAAGLDPRQIILNAAEMIVKQALVDGFFHADPHPGNFYVLENNVIGIMDFGLVGYLSERVRTDLIRLFIVSVLMDSEGIVDQLIRMSVTRAPIHRERLRRDLERILTHYYGMPLKYISAREVINDLLPIMYRHHLSLPPDLWLLGKTLSMWEGIAYVLYPDFDFFAVADPYVRRFLREQRSLRAISRQAGTVLTQWTSLILDLPRVLRPILLQLEQETWTLPVKQEVDSRYYAALDRFGRRVALSFLVAALLVGFGFLLPHLDLSWPWNTTTWLIIPGFIGLLVLSFWWFWNVFRSP